MKRQSSGVVGHIGPQAPTFSLDMRGVYSIRTLDGHEWVRVVKSDGASMLFRVETEHGQTPERVERAARLFLDLCDTASVERAG